MIITGLFVLALRVHAAGICGQDDFATVETPVYATLPDGKRELIGHECSAGPGDIPRILELLEKRPPGHDSAYFGRGAQALEKLLANPRNRTEAIKRRLFAIAAKHEYRSHDGAFDCLMQFHGDIEVRDLLVRTLEKHPEESTRGKSTGRLIVQSGSTTVVISALERALGDSSAFVRARAAQDLARSGSSAGVPVIRKMLEKPERNLIPDAKLAGVVRAASNVRDSSLLPALREIEAEEKALPWSSGEAVSAIRMTELKYLPSADDRAKYFERLSQDELGLSWMGHRLLPYLKELEISPLELKPFFKTASTSAHFRIAHQGKEGLRRLEALEKKE